MHNIIKVSLTVLEFLHFHQLTLDERKDNLKSIMRHSLKVNIAVGRSTLLRVPPLHNSAS